MAEIDLRRMQTITISGADDLAVASGKSPGELAQELRFLLAVKLFELRRVSLGTAAEICGMRKLRFMDELAQLKIPVINLDDEQIQEELRDD